MFTILFCINTVPTLFRKSVYLNEMHFTKAPLQNPRPIKCVTYRQHRHLVNPKRTISMGHVEDPKYSWQVFKYKFRAQMYYNVAYRVIFRIVYIKSIRTQPMRPLLDMPVMIYILVTLNVFLESGMIKCPRG